MDYTNFSFEVSPEGVLCIMDRKSKNQASVTNAIELVLDRIHELGYDLRTMKRCIYLDSENIWDGVALTQDHEDEQPHFDGFYSLGTKSRTLAIHLALEHDNHRTRTALLLPVEGAPQLVDAFSIELTDMQEAVGGGSIQVLQLPGATILALEREYPRLKLGTRGFLVFNEEGRLRKMPFNPAASGLCALSNIADVDIVGPAFVVNMP